MKVLNDLLAYSNRQLYQDNEMFNFTLDSILVARFINLSTKVKKIVDFGTNNAVIPLILTKYTKAQIVGVEIQPKAVAIAKENLELNNLTDQVTIVEGDIKTFASQNIHGFDAVICNPPFFKIEGKPKTKLISQEVVHARHEVLISLEEIIQAASQCLNNGGSFTLVHRAERTSEIINLFAKHHFVVKRMQFVHSKINKPAKTVLIEGIKSGNQGMTILEPLIAHNSDETYTDELLKFFRD
jgi:tRNA1(Val) A37 N6-methylase TrmN6